MLWRRDVTEIALARSEHFISNTQAESLPNFHTNSKCVIRLEIGRGGGGLVIHFVILAETGLWEQLVGPRKWSQWSHSAAICKFWKLGSFSFLKLRLYSWARAMWLWVCPALAKMGSPWLSPAHTLFPQPEPVITSCTTCLGSWGPCAAPPITEPFTANSLVLAGGQGNQGRC